VSTVEVRRRHDRSVLKFMSKRPGVGLQVELMPLGVEARRGVATLASFLLSALWGVGGGLGSREDSAVAGGALALLIGLGELTGKDLEFVRSMLPLLRSRRRAFGTPE
jgi:hypothetical protein